MARNKRKTLRERITTNYFTLSGVLVVCALLWLLPAGTDYRTWGGFAVAVVLTFLLRESNNHFQWIRVRSRMTSSTFLMLATVCLPCHSLSWAWIPPFCLLGAYDLLFAALSQRRPAGYVFHAFLLLTLGTAVWPQMAFMLPLFMWQLGFRLHILSWRTFFAALLGIAFPLWLYFAWSLWTDSVPTMFAFLQICRMWSVPDLTQWASAPRFYFAFIMVCAFFGLLHYARARFRDKKIVRDMHYVMISHELLLLVLMVLFPADFSLMLPVVLLNTAPLLSHYFTLAKGHWPMGIWFDVWLIGFALIWTAGQMGWWGL